MNDKTPIEPDTAINEELGHAQETPWSVAEWVVREALGDDAHLYELDPTRPPTGDLRQRPDRWNGVDVHVYIPLVRKG